MAYVALYRAYRPQKFEDVVGQEHIIKTLQNAITLNKVAHAYLFCGPRGTGKTTLAKIMAKAMNCIHGPTKEPCGKCEICEGITKGTISDVIEIDAASNNGADDIRALRDTVKFLPAVGKYKIYIIDEVHMLSNAAFNALLKTLEEPPKHVIFILATTEPYKLPNTILSRCQRFDFQSISIDDILKRLRVVANEEKIKISDEALYQIATSAEGGMRDALSLFDQCISFSINEEISLDDVLAVSGNISYLKIIDLLEACISDTETDAIILLDKIIKDGKEVPRIINDIILFLRDVLLYKNNAILDDKLMFKNDKFKKLTNKLTKSLIYSWLDILNDATNQMRFSTQKRAYIELAILKMNDTKLNADSTISDRIESLENAISAIYSNQDIHKPDIRTTQPMAQTVIPVNETKPIESTNSNNSTLDEVTIEDVERIINNASKTKKEELLQIWSKISEKYTDIFTIQILVRGKIVAVSDDAFIVELQDVGFCNRVMQYENYVKIMEIFNEFNLNIKDYICIPKAIWSKIITDYKSKYSSSNPKPKLEPINIGVKKRIIPSSTNISKEDSITNKVLEYFEDNILKITED
ncbi:MAG: DNA polymerase III subunit gamma/tau [Anaeroplasma sp.]